jgi:hypothetical protein
LNRIDEIVTFRALDRTTLIRIVEIQLGLLQQINKNRDGSNYSPPSFFGNRVDFVRLLQSLCSFAMTV